MKVVKETDEIRRDGGLAWAIDSTGWKMMLTYEEAKHWPNVVRIERWIKHGDSWVEPTPNHPSNWSDPIPLAEAVKNNPVVAQMVEDLKSGKASLS